MAHNAHTAERHRLAEHQDEADNRAADAFYKIRPPPFVRYISAHDKKYRRHEKSVSRVIRHLEYQIIKSPQIRYSIDDPVIAVAEQPYKVQQQCCRHSFFVSHAPHKIPRYNSTGDGRRQIPQMIQRPVDQNIL